MDQLNLTGNNNFKNTHFQQTMPASNPYLTNMMPNNLFAKPDTTVNNNFPSIGNTLSTDLWQ